MSNATYLSLDSVTEFNVTFTVGVPGGFGPTAAAGYIVAAGVIAIAGIFIQVKVRICFQCSH